MQEKIEKAQNFIQNNPNYSVNDLLNLKDAELILIVALESNFNDFGLLRKQIEELDSFSLEEKIEKYSGTILFNLLVPQDLKTCISCYSLGGEYQAIGEEILEDIYEYGEFSDPQKLLDEIKDNSIFSKDFLSFVENINVMVDDSNHQDAFDEIDEKIESGDVILDDERESYFYEKLKLHKFSEVKFTQKKELDKILRDNEKDFDFKTPNPLKNLDVISKVFLNGNILKHNIEFKINISLLENALGLYKIKKEPWGKNLKESAEKNLKKAGKDIAVELALDAGFSLIPVIGPLIKTGLTKGITLGKDIVADAASERSNSFSFEREEDIFNQFMKSEENDIRKFLSNLVINDLKNVIFKEFNYDIKQEEEGFLLKLSEGIVNKFIQTTLSRTHVITNKKVKDIIYEAPEDSKETLIYLAVNLYLFDEFVEEKEAKDLFLKKNNHLQL